MTNEDQLRGLVIISALLNFVDWLNSQDYLTIYGEAERGKLVVSFLESHSKDKNYFLQASDIAKRLKIGLTDDQV